MSALALQAAALYDGGPPLAPLTLLPCCEAGPEGEIVVCAARPDRYRLPLPHERAPVASTDHRASTGLAALTPSARCGIFEGERRCSKREAEAHGYGRGRDPVTLLLRAGAALLDPDTGTGRP